MNRREMFLLKTWHASALNKLYENVSDVNLHIVKKREIDLFHFLPFLHFEMWLKRQACQVKNSHKTGFNCTHRYLIEGDTVSAK